MRRRPRVHVNAGPSFPVSQWRWRESNPRPPSLHQGFSGRSVPRLYSALTIPHTGRDDRPSRCELSRPSPRPRWAVSHLADARIRAGDEPGLTDLLTLIRQRKRSRRDCCRRLFCLRRLFNEGSNANLGPLPLTPRPESRPFTPSIGYPSRVAPARVPISRLPFVQHTARNQSSEGDISDSASSWTP